MAVSLMNYCTIVPDIVHSFYMSTVETNKRVFIYIYIYLFYCTVQTGSNNDELEPQDITEPKYPPEPYRIHHRGIDVLYFYPRTHQECT